ncbi:MAG TPA: hypothetical protein EYP73_03365 [Acidimicrobiia bacterium]|nr:hypothetical protein [Acidimicrobiia bacterium]
METLGFFDEPVAIQTWSTPMSTPLVSAVPAPSQHTAPTAGEDFLAGWDSTTVDSRLLKGRVRWGLAITLTLLVAGLSVLALWLYRQPQVAAAQGLLQTQEIAADLDARLSALEDLNRSLLGDDLDPTEATSVLLAVDESARDLFRSSAELTSAPSAIRSRAADAAGEALDAASQLGDLIAYQAAIAPFLAAPQLETDPTLISLEEAARLFGEWRAELDQVRAALPDGVLPEVATELTLVSAEMDTFQRQYLDSLRTGTGATGALEALSRRLAEVEQSLEEALISGQAEVAARIERSRDDLEALLG